MTYRYKKLRQLIFASKVLFKSFAYFYFFSQPRRKFELFILKFNFCEGIYGKNENFCFYSISKKIKRFEHHFIKFWTNINMLRISIYPPASLAAITTGEHVKLTHSVK